MCQHFENCLKVESRQSYGNEKKTLFLAHPISITLAKCTEKEEGGMCIDLLS